MSSGFHPGLNPPFSVAATALSTRGLLELHFDNCSVTRIAGKKMSAVGPEPLLMLALSFQLHCSGLVLQEQEGYSLSLVFLGGRPEWNPAAKCYFPAKVKSVSHIWSSLWVLSKQPLRPCTISRVIKDRQARSPGVRSEPPAVRRGIFLQRRHEPRGRYQLRL